MSTFNFHTFRVNDLLTCSDQLKTHTHGSTSMEEVASRVVDYLYNAFVDFDNKKACVLIRFYTTMRYEDLSVLLKGIVRANLEGGHATLDMKCLTLLGTVGDRPAWNARQTSVNHQVIPLPSPDIIQQSPMISQLMQQFGLDIGAFLRQDPNLMISPKKTYNVFYIPEAKASPYVPAQDTFVIPMNVQSVLGFGGLLPSGNLFAVIVFSKVPISKDAAEMCKSLALTIRGLVLPYDQGPIFSRRLH